MYKLGNIMLLISTTVFLIIGGGIIAHIIPKSSPIVTPSSVIALILLGAGLSLKKKSRPKE